MPAWTPAERRGALLIVVLLSLAAARDLWRATHPRRTPAPATAGIASPAAPPGGVSREAGGSPGAATPHPVDLNRAGLADLDALPGIGPVLAGRIIRYRGQHGPFREPEELLAVTGIGPRLFERLRPLICVRTAADSSRGPAAAQRPARPARRSRARRNAFLRALSLVARRAAAFGNPAVAGRMQIPRQERPPSGR
jgi:competence ComEA-like helix-hairpin-helix protein